MGFKRVGGRFEDGGISAVYWSSWPVFTPILIFIYFADLSYWYFLPKGHSSHSYFYCKNHQQTNLTNTLSLRLVYILQCIFESKDCAHVNSYVYLFCRLIVLIFLPKAHPSLSYYFYRIFCSCCWSTVYYPMNYNIWMSWIMSVADCDYLGLWPWLYYGLPHEVLFLYLEHVLHTVLYSSECM